MRPSSSSFLYLGKPSRRLGYARQGTAGSGVGNDRKRWRNAGFRRSVRGFSVGRRSRSTSQRDCRGWHCLISWATCRSAGCSRRDISAKPSEMRLPPAPVTGRRVVRRLLSQQCVCRAVTNRLHCDALGAAGLSQGRLTSPGNRRAAASRSAGRSGGHCRSRSCQGPRDASLANLPRSRGHAGTARSPVPH